MAKEKIDKLPAEKFNFAITSEQVLIDKNASEKLIPILSKYSFFDLCRAIFCINSWRYNRPNLSFGLTLNYVISKIDRSGTRRIQTYKQFISFYNTIYPTLAK